MGSSNRKRDASRSRLEATKVGSGTYAKQRIRNIEGNEAHADMLIAVRRGVCTMLSDEVSDEGKERQWTAWLNEDGTLTIDHWEHSEDVGWTKATSFDVDVNGVASLAQVLDRHGL
jgi:hypothetical protein